MSLADDVRRGLTMPGEKHIPSIHFYDAEGSALFEEITRQPEYYLTETERALLVAHADEIVAAADAGPCLVELGAGSAYKTRVVIDALLARHEAMEYVPIDVSEAALDEARTRLNGRLASRVTVRPLLAQNRDGLQEIARVRGEDAPHLVLFLGSSIGNMGFTEATAFLTEVRRALRPRDRFLLGTDMVKDPGILIPAYQDAAGVTRRFNLNLLARINRELGADFDLDAWRHEARWNPQESRMESHLIATRPLTVHVPKLDLTVDFREGDAIHTENSYKYTSATVERMVRESGFTRVCSWFDDRAWFGLHLLAPAPTG